MAYHCWEAVCNFCIDEMLSRVKVLMNQTGLFLWLDTPIGALFVTHASKLMTQQSIFTSSSDLTVTINMQEECFNPDDLHNVMPTSWHLVIVYSVLLYYLSVKYSFGLKCYYTVLCMQAVKHPVVGTVYVTPFVAEA